MSGPVIIAAGGTGGHMFPAVALGKELLARGQAVSLLTDDRGARYVPRELPMTLVSSGSPSGSLAVRARGLAQLARGLIQSVRLVRRVRPVAAAAFGGYACVPPALAAAWARIPLLVHEQNAVIGRANRLVARYARKVALSFGDTEALPPAARGACVVAGNPVRPGFAATVAAYVPPGAGRPVRLLVLGGSQGARVFSDLLPAALATLPSELRGRVEVVQQCRPEDLERVREAYAAGGIAAELAPFFEDVAGRMEAAHLVVARAGASTVAELLLLGRPSLLVPYPHAVDDHQRANADRLAAAGAAIAVVQGELNAERLGQLLGDTLGDPVRLRAMAAAARGLAAPDAARALADLVLELARERRR